MTEESDGWASLADIGRLGIDTAASVVERLLAVSRSAADIPMPFLAPTGDGDGSRRLRADAERLIDLYAEWTRGLLDNAVATVGRGVAATERVVVGPVGAGATASASVWLHTAAGAAGDGHVRASDLVAHHGGVIPSDAVSCTPAAVDTAAADTTQEVRVAVAVPAGAEPGPYHGHLLVGGLADVALPVRVDVVDTPGT